MSRPGAWVQAWRNFLLSLKGSTLRKKIYVGVDKAGNRFYEYEVTRLNVKRFSGFEPSDKKNFSGIASAEWRAWLNNKRQLPPTDDEILFNEMKYKKELSQEHEQDVEMSRRAPFVDSKGKGAADIDQSGTFPIYKDIEISAGVKLNEKKE